MREVYVGRSIRMVRMVLTDLDHTLLRQDGSISEASLEVIAACRRKGIRLAIATARYWIGAERYIRLLKPDYEITTDGTLIHAEEECIYSKAFSIGDTNRIVRSVKERMPGTEISVAHGKTVFWNSKHIAESERLYKAVYNDYSRNLEVGANAIPEVLAVADEITASNDEDGVAEWMRRNCLK